MYVYINSEPGLWTVGFYDPSGKWVPESDQRSESDAAAQVAKLNGASVPDSQMPDDPISLRDEFAKAAMQAYITSAFATMVATQDGTEWVSGWLQDISQSAYEAADSMLAARSA